jgi:mannosylglycerate hydrolase
LPSSRPRPSPLAEVGAISQSRTKGTPVAHTLFVVSHTHWDREWYLPLQEFRTRLVSLMDKLLDILASDPGYRHFTLDGQTIILEDYLAIRPERRQQLTRHVREGRVLIGPWYVLPDEFLVSPEALIRNLMLGDRLAREFGAVMKVGYTPDPFGHVGQLPQILQGFGIDTAVLERGLSDENTELRWQAPDGSEVLLIYLRDGYDNAAHLPVEDDKAFLSRVTSLKESLAPYAATPCLLLMNGTDHMEPQPGLPEALVRLRRELPDGAVAHSTLPSYIESVRTSLGNKYLATVSGELRSPRRFHLLAGVLSARMYLKQRNHACQTLLEKWAEPFAAFAQLVDPQKSDLQARISQAWHHLLQNHPHDSICGCSADQVHQEMVDRFARCEDIAEAAARDSLETITSSIDLASAAVGGAEPGIPIVVFNPLSWCRTDVVEVTLNLPRDLEQFVVLDTLGRPIPHQSVEEDRGSRVLLVARDVPAFGYKTYFLRSGRQAEASKAARDFAIENEFYYLEVEPRDGTFSVTDKASGALYQGLNRLVDGGDRGDEYNYCQPEEDLIISAPSQPPVVSVLERGPARQSVEIRLTYELPAGLTGDRRSRTWDRVEVPVTSCISLCAQVPRIDVRTTVTNRARDHRLRAHFPTPVCVETSFAESAFDVVERPIALPHDTAEWIEQPVPTHPQASFVDLSDGQRGLMLANRGLPEYEAFHDGDGTTLALTLLRCVGWLSRDDLACRRGPAGPQLETPEAQCLGTYHFDYALIPHTGDWHGAFQRAHAFNAPLRAIVTNLHSGALPAEASFLEVSPPSLFASAIKLAEDGHALIVRVDNVEDHEVEAEVVPHTTPVGATLVNLNEEEARELRVGIGGRLSLPVGGKRLVTLRFRF